MKRRQFLNDIIGTAISAFVPVSMLPGIDQKYWEVNEIDYSWHLDPNPDPSMITEINTVQCTKRYVKNCKLLMTEELKNKLARFYDWSPEHFAQMKKLIKKAELDERDTYTFQWKKPSV